MAEGKLCILKNNVILTGAHLGKDMYEVNLKLYKPKVLTAFQKEHGDTIITTRDSDIWGAVTPTSDNIPLEEELHVNQSSICRCMLTPNKMPHFKSIPPMQQNRPLTSMEHITQLLQPTILDSEEGSEQDDNEPSLPIAACSTNVGTVGVSGLGPQQEAILTQLVQDKLSNLLGKILGYIESLPVEVRYNVEALKDTQTELTKFQMEHKEVLELECKYLPLYILLFDHQLAITLGNVMPIPDEIMARKTQSLRDDPTHTMIPLVSPGTTQSTNQQWKEDKDLRIS